MVLQNKSSVSALIATILLIVVAVALIVILLTWGKSFTTNSISEVDTFKDASSTYFIKPVQLVNGSLIFKNISTTQDDITITGYKIIASDPDTNQEIQYLDTPIVLSQGSQNGIKIPLLPTDKTFTVQLYTSDGKYIDIKNIINTGSTIVEVPEVPCVSGGTGTEENPIIVCTADDLNNVRNDLDAYYVLGKDIDLDISPYNTGEGWVPIGDSSNKFEGVFDGQGHTISHIYINRPSEDYIGLFGYLYDSNFYNLNLLDINYIGSDNLGGLAGYVVSDYDSIALIYNVNSSGNISGRDGVGGLIGTSEAYYNFRNCSFLGNINGNSSVGGLIGYGEFSTDIYFSYSSSSVTATNIQIGGLIGFSGYSNISNSYSIGSVEGNSKIGGLAGSVGFGTILNSYSISNISGNSLIGGLIGEDSGMGNIISNSYWDINTSGQTNSSGGEGKTTTQMKQQATFVDWNFTSIWNIVEDVNYPFLR